MSDTLASQVRCDGHHWVSTHQPDFPVYWIRQCSICGYYDPDDMAKQIAKHATTPEHASLKTERNVALAAISRVEALLNYAADYELPDFVDAIRVALYPVESKPWTVQATTNSELAVASLTEPTK